MTKLAALAAAAVLVTGAAAPAYAAEAEHYTLSGLTATTSFSTTDGCVETRSLATAVDGTVRGGASGSTSSSTLFLFLARVDWCTGDYLVSAFGVIALPADAFTIDRRLTTAALDASGVVHDFVSGTDFVAHARVTWTGSGDTFTHRTRSHTAGEGVATTTRLEETFREASASGSLTDGVTEFAPAPGYGATLGAVRSGSVTVTY